MSRKKQRDPGLSAADRALWDHVMRDATPLGDRAKPSAGSGPEPRVTAAAPADEAGPARKPVARDPGRTAATTTAPAAGLSGIDGAFARRLRRGQIGIERRIDLHGMTQRAAHAALDRFLARAQDEGRRAVLVITGKGLYNKGDARQGDDAPFMRRDTTGVLRAAVPRWLREGDNRHRVIAYHPARPRHGGAGAIYVVLRRRLSKE